MMERGFLLNGEWRTRGEVVEIRSPFDQKAVGKTYLATKRDVEVAMVAAERAFLLTRQMPAFRRQEILQRVSAGIAAKKNEFARSIALEAGKPITTAHGEVERAIFTFQVAAEESTRINGEVLPLDLQAATAGRWGMVRRHPIGPIAAITPFNFPLNLVAHKLAPAMACGCPVVLKPAPQTPLTALLLADVVLDAGWPAGALHVLPLSNEDAALLVSDDRLKMLSFTGSARIGWALKAKTGKKRVTLELGGNAGVIIHSDADISHAAGRCVTGGFSYAGQSCISVQRVFVHQNIGRQFIEQLVAGVGKLKCGDPMDETTDVGPMIRESDAKRAEEWINEAVAGGAKLLCGGKRTGSMLEPTVLTNTKPAMKVNCEEVFAPVLTVEAYDDFMDAVAQVNDSPYGLQAGLFTRDAALIFAAYEALEVGGLIVGDVPTFRIDHMPYGGVKDSGLGREGIRYAIEEMTERKLLVMNLPPA